MGGVGGVWGGGGGGCVFFFFNDTATTEIYTLSLHDALPILHAACALHTGLKAVKRRKSLNITHSVEAFLVSASGRSGTRGDFGRWW